MKHVLSILLICFTVSASAQKQGNIWHFGEGAGLDFNSGTATPISGGQIFGNPQNANEFLYSEGCATICDSAGNLLFYTNGEKVWNRNHQVMPNGGNLMGMYSSTHAAFIIPRPLSDSLFYVFTTDGLERDLANGLRYSMVDMCKEGGFGDVEIDLKNVLLLDTVSEKLCAIPHENGKDIWLIAHKFNSDMFYAYQISEFGVVNTVTTSIGSVHTGNGYYSAIGQMKASPDGNKIALTFSNINPSVAELFDFNDSTGVLSNPISLLASYNEYGIEFSADNSKLYLGSLSGLHQFDLSSGIEATINASKTLISSSVCLPSGMQLGPDDKIYVSTCSNNIAIINNPNALGTACNYVINAINLGSTQGKVSFPNFISGYNYNNAVPSCLIGINPNPTLTSETLDLLSFEIYPNPAEDHVTIKVDETSLQKYSLRVHDELGRSVLIVPTLTNTETQIDVSKLDRGTYFVTLFVDGGRGKTEKLAVF